MPAVIIPTVTERESNAWRLAALGAGEIVMPVDGANGEKHVDVAGFGAKVDPVFNAPGYHIPARRDPAKSMRQFGGAHEAPERIEQLGTGTV